MDLKQQTAIIVKRLDRENRRLEKKIKKMQDEIVRRLLAGDTALRTAIDNVIVETEAKLERTEKELAAFRNNF